MAKDKTKFHLTTIIICTIVHVHCFISAKIKLMYVCLCKGITDTQIQEAVGLGAASLKDVRKELGVATQCCKCLPLARNI